MTLGQIINPSSMALVGASPKPTSPARNLIRNLDLLGYSGRVYAVNPGYDEVYGRPCVPRMQDLPEPVEAAVIMLPARAVPAVMDELGASGIRSAVVLTSGFAEAGPDGRAYERALKVKAHAAGVQVVGPNCMGSLNFATGACTSFTTLFDYEPVRRGAVAVVSQSGGMGASIYSLGVEAGLGFSHLLSSGNEAMVDLVDFVEYLIDDPATGVICAYAEQIKRGRELLEAARRVSVAGKRLVILKSGRGRAGSRAAVSHTAAIAADDAVVSDLFESFGIVKVHTPAELVGAVSLLLRSRVLPKRGSIAVVTPTGGTAVLATDLAEDAGLQLPSLSSLTKARVAANLPTFASVRNPVDLTGAIVDQREQLSAVLEAVDQDPRIEATVVLNVLASDGARRFALTVAPLLADLEKPALAAWIAGGPEIAAIFGRSEVPFFSDPRLAMQTLANVVRASSARDPGKPPPWSQTATKRVKRRVVVTEHSLKAELVASGIVIANEAVGRTAEEVAEAASRVGYPVALKVLSPDIPHRAQVGALALGLGSAAAVADAFKSIVARLRQNLPDASVEGYLVQRMVRAEHELLVGISNDPCFGPIVTFGRGGSDVERRRAVVHYLLPLTSRSARALVADYVRTGGDLPLEGRVQSAQLLLKVSRWWSQRQPRMVEVDLNPVVWTGTELVVVDALGVF